jgi:hypothetical protein
LANGLPDPKESSQEGQLDDKLPGLPFSIALLIIGLLGCTGCRPGDVIGGRSEAGIPEVAAVGATTRTPSPGPPVDLSRVMRQVHYAFRREGDQLESSLGNYAVHVSGDGEVELTAQARSGGVARASSPMRLHTRSLGRPSAMAPRPPGASARLADDGAAVVERPAAVERLENTEAGLEQSWTFGTMPDGVGDLVADIRVEGLEYVGETANGLHFRDPDSGLGFSYGVATWVDAKGTRVEVRPRLTDGQVVLAVTQAVVEGSAYPATLDPTIGPEIAVDTPVPSEAGGQQNTPVTAFDGTNYLVVWVDGRNAPLGDDIWGARVSPAGAVLDPNGILICSAVGEQVAPSIAFDGTNYLIVWQDFRNAPGSVDLYGARVSPAAAVLDPGGFVVGSGGSSSQPAITFDGTNYFAVWTDARSGSHIYGSRISPAGVVLDASGIAVSPLTGTQDSPAVTFGSGNSLVTWVDRNQSGSSGPDLYGRLVSKAGVLVGTGPIAITVATGTQDSPALAFDGSNFLAVWVDGGATHGARISAAGTLLDASGITIAGGSNPGVAFDGTNYVIARSGGSPNQVYATRLSPAGVVLDGYGVLLGTGFGHLGIGVSGSNELVVWSSNNHVSIQGMRITKAFALQDAASFTVSTASNAEETPSIATDGTGYLAVWSDYRGLQTGWDVYAMRLDAAGTPVDPAAIAVSSGAGDQRAPAVAFDGTDYLIVWTDISTTTRVAAVRFGASGSAVGAPFDVLAPLSLANYSLSSPAIAFGAGNYLVVWPLTTLGINVTVLQGAHVSTGGSVQALQNNVSDPGNPRSGAVAFDGTNFLVTYRDGTGSGSVVRGVRVAGTGERLAASFAVSGAGGGSDRPNVAFDGTNYFVAWGDNRNAATTGTDLYGSRVAPDGTVLDAAGIPISTAASAQQNPGIAFDGYNYFLIWEDGRDGTALNLYGRRVGQSGGVVDPSDFLVSNLGNSETAPALTFAVKGQGLLSYYRFRNPLGATRVYARTISSGPALGTACATGLDCASNFCVDGVCCDTACGGSCDVCSSALGATADGTCTVLSVGSTGSPSCSPFACNGTSASCPTSCATDTDCPSGTFCAAGGACKAQLALGATCTIAAGQQCQAAGCRLCATGQCVDGFCCSAPCAAACDVCSSVLGAPSNGTCATAPQGITTAQCAAPRACNGTSTSCAAACATDADCVAGAYCSAQNGGTCQTRKALGAACNAATGGDCQTAGCRVCDTTTAGCVDGVCCNQACSGACAECKPGTGLCSPVAAGSLGNPTCGLYVCSGFSLDCPSGCGTDADCDQTAPGAYCDAGHQCQPKSDLGASCGGDNECMGGHCVDSVCCDSLCNGTCEACVFAKTGQGSDGHCAGVTKGTDPDDECSQDSPATCLRNGYCNGVGACDTWPQGTDCSTATTGKNTCSGNKAVGWICPGNGVACNQATSGVDCGPQKCVNGACAPCVTSADCLDPNASYCNPSGTCLARKVQGASCGTGDECLSTFCVDGVCCAEVCDKQCEWCGDPAQPGVCEVAPEGQPKNGRAACPGAGVSPCGSECDGAKRDGCVYPGSAKKCTSPQCVNDSRIPAGTCDNSGGCTTGKLTACGTFTCDPAAGECKKTCATTADCRRGAVCDTSSGTGTCNAAGATCVGADSVKDTEGTVSSCNGYLCVAGQCQQQCGSDADCATASGYRCVASACVVASVDGGSGSGGATGSGGAPAGLGGATAGGGALGSGGTTGGVGGAIGGVGGTSGGSASGGASTVSGGAFGFDAGIKGNSGGGATAATQSRDAGGCGCRVSTRVPSPLPWAGAVSLVALSLARRRRYAFGRPQQRARDA